MSRADTPGSDAPPRARTGRGDAALRADVLSATAELERLVAEWQALLERCPWATPFQSPEWQLAWWREFGNDGLRAVAVRRAGELVGLAPFFVYGLPGEPRRLTLLADGVSDYQDVLLEPGSARAALRLVFDRIAALRGEWDVCELGELRPGSPLLAPELLAALPDGLEATTAPLGICMSLPTPASAGALEARLSPRFRRRLRRADEAVRAAGRAEFVMADADTLPELLDALIRLHTLRWTERGEPGVLGDPRIQRFLRAAATGLLERGRLRLYALRLDDAPIAVLLAFSLADRMYAYLTGLDPAAAPLHPGMLLLRHVVEDAIRAGFREVDFLRGEEEYKRSWGPVEGRSYRVVVRWDRGRGKRRA
ncbi:MAG TPA: GNAT family N-acetyltransferase [Longimicrobiales bacterium]|nr:GNAT family N-acetyltransferase [Longimicrobiales bacterium]